MGLGYLCSIPKQTAFQYLVSGTNFLGQSCTKILVRRHIDPMQKWPPLIFVTEKKYLLTEINYFTVKIRLKGMKF